MIWLRGGVILTLAVIGLTDFNAADKPTTGIPTVVVLVDHGKVVDAEVIKVSQRGAALVIGKPVGNTGETVVGERIVIDQVQQHAIDIQPKLSALASHFQDVDGL